MTRVLLINLDRIAQVSSVLTDREIELSVITTKQNSRYYKESRVGIIKDLTDADQAYKMTLRLSGLSGFDYVVTPLERALIPAGLIRSNLGIQGMTYDQALGFANKFVMKERIQKAGIPVARYNLVPHVSAVPEAGARVGWPIVLKPVVGSGAQYTYRLFSEKHARSQIRRDRDLRLLARRGVPMLAEHQLDVIGEFHCDGVVYDGKIVFASVSRYIRPLLDCVGSFAGSFILDDGDPLIPLIRELHSRAVNALGMADGVTHLEVFLTPDGLVFGEIAGRPGGSGVASNIARKYPVNLWETFIGLQLGRGPGAALTVPDTPQPDESIIGWLGVPVQNGRVMEITQPEDFATIPGVQETKMLYQVGDLIDERRATGSLAAYVYFVAQNEIELNSIVKKISAKYHIRTDVSPTARSDCGKPSE